MEAVHELRNEGALLLYCDTGMSFSFLFEKYPFLDSIIMRFPKKIRDKILEKLDIPKDGEEYFGKLKIEKHDKIIEEFIR